MTTDWRALCVDLVAWADYTSAHYYAPPEVLIRARAALAEPEPEGPTDEEIMGLMPQQMRDDLAAAARALAGFDPDNIKAASACRTILNRHSIDLARAVLARWGTPNLTETRSSLKDAWAANQPAIEAAAKAGMDACRVDGPAVPDGREPASVIEEPSDEELLELMPQKMREDLAEVSRLASLESGGPAAADFYRTMLNIRVAQYARAALARWGRPAPAPDGEVCELVRKLREQAAAYSAYPDHAPLIEEWARCFTRAADLLEQRQAAPVPVPVSERLPGPEDCDEDGRCWWYGDGEDMVGWTFQDLEGLSYYKATHWLPAHALPVPTTEAQP